MSSRATRFGKRLVLDMVQALPVAFGVVVITFLLVRLTPGDPAAVILGTRVTPESLAALREELRLDRPLLEQFGAYAGGLLTGDLGNSTVQQGRPVSDVIMSALPVSLALVGMTIALAVTVAVPLGLWAGLTRHPGVDVTIRSAATFAIAIPPFFLGLLLLLIVSLQWGLLPAGGWGDGWPENFRYAILPVIALSGFLGVQTLRTVRQAATDVARQQFVEAAVARGVAPRTIVFRHILPNCIGPVITLVGLSFGTLIAGAVVIETIFALPGLGTELVQAVASRDYTIIQGIALVTAILVVMGNVLADAAQALVDPRVGRR